jgi:hypothetical protein
MIHLIALMRVVLWVAVVALLAWAASDLERVLSREEVGWEAFDRNVEQAMDFLHRHGR